MCSLSLSSLQYCIVLLYTGIFLRILHILAFNKQNYQNNSLSLSLLLPALLVCPSLNVVDGLIPVPETPPLVVVLVLTYPPLLTLELDTPPPLVRVNDTASPKLGGEVPDEKTTPLPAAILAPVDELTLGAADGWMGGALVLPR